MTNDTQARAGPDPCSQITDDSKELIHHLRGLDRDCLLERNLHHERSRLTQPKNQKNYPLENPGLDTNRGYEKCSHRMTRRALIHSFYEN